MKRKKKSQPQPLVSIVMPVYNAELYLAEAIESVRRQTYSRWELILVDDASNDKSVKIAQRFAKRSKKVTLYRNRRNRGVAFTANKAITKARGQFIARMDADDVMLPSRLEKQVRYLMAHPETVMVGTQCRLIDHRGKTIGQKQFPLDAQSVKKQGFITLPIQQPSVMVNTALLPKGFVWYQDQVVSAEEHELFFKLLQYGQIANLPQMLHQYRFHGKNLSLQQPKADFFRIFKARLKGVQKYGYRPDVWSLLANAAQLIIITLFPGKLLYPAFFYLRDLVTGAKRKSFGYFLALR